MQCASGNSMMMGNAPLRGATGRQQAPARSSPAARLRPQALPLGRLAAARPQQQGRAWRCRAEQQQEAQQASGSGEAQPGAPPPPPAAAEQQLVGEDAAVFNVEDQSLRSWALFAVLLTGVSALLYPVRRRRRSPDPAAPCLLASRPPPRRCRPARGDHSASQPSRGHRPRAPIPALFRGRLPNPAAGAAPPTPAAAPPHPTPPPAPAARPASLPRSGWRLAWAWATTSSPPSPPSPPTHPSSCWPSCSSLPSHTPAWPSCAPTVRRGASGVVLIVPVSPRGCRGRAVENDGS